MSKRNLIFVTVLLVIVLALGACGTLQANLPAIASAQGATPAASSTAPATGGATAVAPNAQPTASQPTAPAIAASPSLSTVQGFEGSLEQIYASVNPSVVTINVTGSAQGTTPNNRFFGPPQLQPQPQQGLGSGFVWDTNGNIVTNNHVIAGASSISVTFADGTIVTGQVVGADPNSDLAVVKVNAPTSELHPVQVGDSNQIKVGQLAIAIGNPFGEQNTMTTGIISALGRSLPVNDGAVQGPSYQIPDVIQTDAPINPGNSGGVLLNAQGQVIGVTAAIESNTRSSSGIGFAIPSAIVQKVVPALIQTGHYDHPYLGISGTSLTPDLAKAMNLSADQRGALVGQVTAGGPAAQAGLQGSTKQVTIQGQPISVGGDVITAFNGQPVKSFDDLIALLERTGQIGQNATLTILRNGQPQTVTVKVGARPASQNTQSTTPTGRGNTNVTLGIRGLALTPAIAQAMSLQANQQGVLVEQVQAGSPADQAGLQGSSKTATINGATIPIGGDVITAINGKTVTTVAQLSSALQSNAGQTVTLTILRGGKQQDVPVNLGASAGPTTTP